MLTQRKQAAIGLAFLAAVMSSAHAAETRVIEESCTLEGFPRPLRQTIAVIDELAVEPWTSGEISDANRRWINAVISLAGSKRANEMRVLPRARG